MISINFSALIGEMFEWLKTPSGAYNLTLIVAIIAWLVTGGGIIAGFHLNKIRTIAAQESAKKAEAARDDVSKELSIAKKELAEIKEKQGPWPLSAEKKLAFLNQLKEAPKGRVAIEYIRSDEIRSHEFAVRVKDILTEAGYDVWGYMPGFEQADASPLVGVRIIVKPGKSDLVGGGIQRAFQAIEIPADGARTMSQDYEDDFAVIWIGLRP